MKKILDNINFSNINSSLFFLNKILKILYILLLIVIVYILNLIFKEWKLVNVIINIFKLLSPVLIGIVIAYLLNPLVKMLSKKINRTLSIIIIYTFIVLIITFLTIYICPKFKTELNDLIKYLPNIIDEAEIFFNNIFKNKIDIDIDKYVIKFVNNNILNKASNILITLKNIIKIIGVFIVSLIISFYILLDFDKINEKLSRLLNKLENKKITKLLIEIDNKVFLYVKGTLLIAFIVFIASLISFNIIKLKGSIFFALYNALTNIIPYIGPYIGAIPIIIVGFTSSKKIGFLSLIILLVTQLLESYVLHPIIMSKSMKLHPVTIFISLLLFGYFFGIIGMVIAMPVVSALKTIAIFIIDEKRLK